MTTPTPLEALLVAARTLLRVHLDDAEVHPCDERNDAVRARQCMPEVQALYAALAAAEQAGPQQPIGEVVCDDVGSLCDAKQVRFHMYAAIPPIGTKLYAAPEAERAEPVAQEAAAEIERLQKALDLISAALTQASRDLHDQSGLPDDGNQMERHWFFPDPLP